METAFIYTLNDPETGEVRYLGKLDNNPRKRLREHISESRTKKHHRACWIKSLTARGLKPTLELLDEVPFGEWEFWEREYIRVFRAIGIRLVNGTDGGEGFGSGENHPWFGGKHTLESLAKISARSAGKNNPMYGKPSPMLGRKASPETIEKQRAWQLGEKSVRFGTKTPPEERAKLRVKDAGSSSKFHGVFWRPDRHKWRVQFKDSGKTIHVGEFKDELEAARAYDTAAKIHHGEYVVLNFP